MGQKDIISKELLKNIARDISKHILHIEIKEDMELINQEFTRVESRESDLIFKNGDEIVHIEIQNNNHPKMHLRMHRYLSDILFEYEDFKIKQYMLYIGKERCSMKNAIKIENLAYIYDIIDIKEIPCKSFLESNDPSAIVLAMLCDFEGKDKQLVVNTILRKIKELNDEQGYRNYLKMVNIFSSNRGLEKEVEKGVEMLTVDIEKTPFYRIGIEKGMQKGIEQGIEKGFEVGLIKGTKDKALESAMIMVKDFQIAIDDVVQKLNIRKDELLDYMKKMDSK